MLTPGRKHYMTCFLNLALLSIAGNRRGGRAAEGPALEKRYPAKSGIVGSNPTLSAMVLLKWGGVPAEI